MKSIKKYLSPIALIMMATMILFSGCKKLVEVETPFIYTSDENAYSTDAKAIAVVNGIYTRMSTARTVSGSSISSYMSFYAGLSADEFKLFPGTVTQEYLYQYRNELQGNRGVNVWGSAYQQIYLINSAIEGISKSAGLSEAVKKELLGESKFLRAYSYFYLVNLYGAVPLALSTDYKVNNLLPRSSVDEVYAQVLIDLKEAAGLLSDRFVAKDGLSVSTERVVPNRWAAKALLARVYLYRKSYLEAAALASEVIAQSTLFELTVPEAVFLKNSREAIWQLQPVNTGFNTEEGYVFVIPVTGPSDTNPILLSDNLLQVFEAFDKRKTQWVGHRIIGTQDYSYVNKYKVASYGAAVTEYQMVFRLAEQYLIRAEANASLGNLQPANDDLNKIRTRAGLPSLSPATKDALLSAILQENRIEFFAEWGHRWLDLKRLGKANEVMTGAAADKGASWQEYDQLYPLPVSDLQNDPNLTQNPGYN